MRMFVAAPRASGNYPGIVCYSDIFQLSGPMLRSVSRLAGYGFLAVAPEIYHRVEPAGTVIPFDDAGRTRGQKSDGWVSLVAFAVHGIWQFHELFEARPQRGVLSSRG